MPGYVMYGFESVAQWHAESNTSIAVQIPRQALLSYPAP
jgi:hypothetical protein